jgi:hypothetical protein
MGEFINSYTKIDIIVSSICFLLITCVIAFIIIQMNLSDGLTPYTVGILCMLYIIWIFLTKLITSLLLYKF